MKLTRNSSGIRKVLFLLFYQTKAQFELTNESLQGSWQKWSAGEARGQKPRHAQWAGWALEKEQGVGEGHLRSEVARKWPGLEPPPALRGRGPGGSGVEEAGVRPRFLAPQRWGPRRSGDSPSLCKVAKANVRRGRRTEPR